MERRHHGISLGTGSAASSLSRFWFLGKGQRAGKGLEEMPSRVSWHWAG